MERGGEHTALGVLEVAVCAGAGGAKVAMLCEVRGCAGGGVGVSREVPNSEPITAERERLGFRQDKASGQETCILLIGWLSELKIK
jgi:hypothetical protein